MSLIETLALRGPVAVGVNTTLNVQLAPPARLAGQVLDCTMKSPGFVPVNVKGRTIVIALVPAFISVTVCGELVIPTVVVGKAKLGGVSLPNVPVPLTETV